jgi:ankyrin repeat protein
MELLLTSRRENLSNVNARSEKYGPVINAAILSGVVRGVELLLGRTELSLDLDSDMESPLALAARVSEPKIFHDILRAGQKTWTREHYEQALEMASRNGRVECVNAIISSSQPLSPNRIEASLLIAGLKDHWEVVDRLLDLAPRISYSNIFFLTATTLSKQSHDHLLERTWDLALSDIPKRVRDAALYRATDNEKKPTVEWLLTKCGADPNATADKPPELAVECVNKFPLVSYGDALTAAAHDGNLDLIRVLLSHGAVVDSEHGAALQTAARQGHLAAVDLLLDKEADIDRIINLDLMEELGMEWKSGTALQAACDYRKDHIVRHLLARKANPNRSCAHSTYTYPVISAAANNQPDILKYLLDVEKTEVKVCEAKDGLSPLHLACERMDLSSVKRLLDRGADINAEDFKGNQALHMAAFKGDSKVVSFLLQHSARTSHNSKDKGLALQEALNNRHIICATLLADATVPIFDSLTSAANTGNGFAESVITNPTGEHPRLDTNKIANLEGDIQRLQKRNEEVENILKKYNYMEKLVGESKLIADEKIEDAEKARAELLDTHKRFDISIAGFDSVRAQCNKLEAETHDLRQENRSQQERLLQHTRHIERTTFEFQSCKTTLQSTENLLEIERQRVQALRAEIEQLRTDTVPRGSVFSTNSSEAFDQSTHGRQSSVSTDRLDAVSPADSDHPASGKGHRSGLARMHKYTKNSLSSVSDVWKKN